MKNCIINGDCVSVCKQIETETIDLTVTSPPYDALRHYNGYQFDFYKIAKELFRITKKGGVVVWVVGDKIKNGNRSLTSFKQALYFQESGFNVHDIMIYAKKNTPFMRRNAYTNCFEFMFVFSKGSPKTFNPLNEDTKRLHEQLEVTIKEIRQGKEKENKRANIKARRGIPREGTVISGNPTQNLKRIQRNNTK